MSITVSVMTGGVSAHPTTSEEANGLNTDFVIPGVVGSIGNTGGIAPSTGGWAINAQGTPDTTVAVAAGVGYVRAQPASQNTQVFRVVNNASQNVTIAANASGSTKYDWLYIKLDATLLNAPTTAGTTTGTLFTSRSTNQTSDDGSPPTYGICIGVITVANGFSTITNSVIRDTRTQADVGVAASANSDWRTGVLPIPNLIFYNGSRNYTLTFNNVDLTGYLSTMMRLRATRVVVSPTQCAVFNGTTQYLVRTGTITGMAFTDDFGVGAWVKLSSISAAADQVIASRYNGTSGWSFFIVAGTAQVCLRGYNAGSSNVSQIIASPPLRLTEWVWVDAQLDMSAFTATPTTSFVMYDGTDMAAIVGRVGSNPTSIIQAGNLEIGSQNGGTALFNGRIAQVAIYGAKVTQGNLRITASQGLIGTETSLVSAFSLSNSLNDLVAGNANNLSVGGGAVVTTNADSPFGGQASGVPSTNTDYATIGTVTFSSPNTLVTVVVPEGCTLPTSGALSALAYSGQNAPYGFRGNTSIYKNMSRSVTNPANLILSSADVDLASQGMLLPVYSPLACTIQVTVSLGISSTADYEFRPEVRIDGTTYFKLVPGAALASAGNRANMRGFTISVPLTAGTHLISAGVDLSAGAAYAGVANGSTLAIGMPGELVV